ncbi:DUF2163 domain-containing protein [Sphingosinicella sp. LHD-64]|uniref:DUF2163 domain-containing protein n=1 Tax=Sphingosinicella sp. LHD-64 TaxID=3072139 RepID=UPI00280DDFA8|nr:DUF2163 domain-containing protein [Sphingosinicella sp. LHD-64]MDQ8757852.1 DUF2163 domain-containing protein [Sphingosinicella sp. LHD-64]
MTSFLQRELITVALCWRLERRDGAALGFTTHDRDLSIDGLIYRAAPGMLPSSISLSDGFDADMLDVEGALTSDAIRAADLKAGRWDGSILSVFMVDWRDPAAQKLSVARGELGEATLKGDGFEAELKGPTAILDRPVAEQTSPECRALLGDRRCRIDMAPRTRLTRIAAVIAEDVVEVASAAPGNAYAYGRLRWISGHSSGLENAILRSDDTRLTLRDAPDLAPQTGDLVEIQEGCDKSLATCASRFANVANFRGEPHLPGMDLLTRYPGA